MELTILITFMICGAIVAIEAKDLISSVVALGAVGFSLCLAFLILKAPDIAITQLVIEILCLIILIRATINKDIPLVIEGRWFFNTLATLIFVVMFLIVSFWALKELPNFGEPIMALVKKYTEEGTKETGAVNLVSAVVLDFRAYDTLGEAAILFSAVLGIMVVLRKPGRKK